LSPPDLDGVSVRLNAFGLAGSAFAPQPEDGAPPGVRTLFVVSGAEPGLWQAFVSSPEREDGRDHPLDRWSRRVIGSVAAMFGGRAFFPDDGPPWWPFRAGSRRAAPVWPSPIGIHIHAERGLWHSVRGAVGLRGAMPLPRPPAATPPCDSCPRRPCMTACPVDAFRDGGLDAERCRSWLAVEAGADCRTLGCRARRACPVGQGFRHPPERAAHHMQAFIRASP